MLVSPDPLSLREGLARETIYDQMGDEEEHVTSHFLEQAEYYRQYCVLQIRCGLDGGNLCLLCKMYLRNSPHVQ